jgi:hypothetical protein
MTRPPLADLTLTDLPQLIDLRRLTCQNTLYHLHRPTHERASGKSIRCSLSLDPDDTNPRIVLTSIMRTITEIAYPGFELRGVVFLDKVAVGDDVCFAGDGGPFTGAVEEGDVDVGVGLEVVCLACRCVSRSEE